MVPYVAAELRDLKAGQNYLLDLLQQLGARRECRDRVDANGEQSLDVATEPNAARYGTGEQLPQVIEYQPGEQRAFTAGAKDASRGHVISLDR